jgi:hypothetical protein
MLPSEIYSLTSQSSIDIFTHLLKWSLERPLLRLIPSSCQVTQRHYLVENKQDVAYFEVTNLPKPSALCRNVT